MPLQAHEETVVTMYRVWTKNSGGSVSIMTDWQTRGACRRMILGRWGCYPGFAFVSKCRSVERFQAIYGE